MNEFRTVLLPHLLFLAACLASNGRAQEAGKVVVLNHADSLVGREINGEQVKELIGNVQFTQGSTVVTCRRAMQYIAANKISLEGEVVVEDSSMRMLCTRGMYYGNDRSAEAFDHVVVEDRNTSVTAEYGKYFSREKKTFFRGNVRVQDTASIMTANELRYDRADEHSDATGNVRIMSPRNRMTISGNHFEDFKRQRFSRMTEHPKLLQIDTLSGGGGDTMVVTGGVMESYQDTLERLVARDSVNIVRGTLAAESGVAIFYPQRDSIILRTSPFVWYAADRSQDNQISGDSIFIRLKERRPETITVRGDAFAVSRADSLYPARFNQMSGQEIILSFAGKAIQRIDVEKTATSLYYLFDGKSPNGLNKASGDRVTILFKEGRLDELKVIAGPEGQYLPEKMVRHKEAEQNLPGFNWRDAAKRPSRKPEGAR